MGRRSRRTSTNLSPAPGEVLTLRCGPIVSGGASLSHLEDGRVVLVAFAAPGNPEIYIDRNSATIVEESDDARAFHLWVMKLHQLQFLGTKKELTLIPGAALLFLLVTGSTIWLRRRRALQ